jgi:indoleamine 2,3-dioxygenase
MEDHLKVMQEMYRIMSSMWHESSPAGYLNFRTFIMGVKGNEDIFPNDVLYKGVSETPFAYRGETGAQDSIIPSVDTAFGLEYPRNALTEYLFQLRSYRPAAHQAHVNWCAEMHKQTDFKKWCFSNSYSAFLMLCNYHMTFKFRHQHWVMVKKYIIDNTKYGRATGGTPITTWLPNQIGACLENCQNLIKVIDTEKLSYEQNCELARIKFEVDTEVQRLFMEVTSLQNEFKG